VLLPETANSPASDNRRRSPDHELADTCGDIRTTGVAGDVPSVQPGSTVTTIQGAYLSDEVGAEASVQRRMRYQPGPLVPRANSRYRFSLEIRQMLDVGYIGVREASEQKMHFGFGW
jgi:hypothetical protein